MWETEALGVHRHTDSLTREITNILRTRGAPETRLPDLVEDSWKRCLTDYNLLPDAVPRASVLSLAEIRDQMEQREEFMRVAEPEIERLFRQLIDSEYLVSLASPEGAMVLFRCDYQYLGELAGAGVIPGSVWTEDQQGTNGVGTCLRLGKAVTIAGTQHYGSAIMRLTCMTAPVLGRTGAIESAINVTTARHADGRVNRMVQNIVERSARRIENGYFGRINRHNLQLRILENGEIADLSEEGRIALDENGRILDGSSSTARLLGHSVNQLLGQSAEDLFEMDQALCDIRPDVPVTLNYRGRILRAVFSLPESSRKPHRSLNQDQVAKSTLRPVDLADEVLRINPILSQAMDRARRTLSVGLPFAVTGESGTGKTAFAKVLARCCFGDDTKFVLVDCTSANAKDDLCRLLDCGTTEQRSCILIDRIDEMDETLQSMLLTLLENHRRQGTNGNAIVVISTLDLDQLVAENRMRPDLMHRLNGGQVTLPSLRSVHDLDATLDDLFRFEREALGKHDVDMDDDVRRILTHYHWPGNLREMRNVLRHAIALADGTRIGLVHLPEKMVAKIAGKDLTARSQSEASKIEAALRYNGGNVSMTARYLGVSRATLYRKIQIQKARGAA